MDYTANFGKEKKNDKLLLKILNILLIATFIVSIGVFGFDSLFFLQQVKGSSMLPTYAGDGGDIVLVARYYNLNRGDIVIIKGESSIIIKRVVAKGGDVISLCKKNNSSYCYYKVNGEEIDESYIADYYKYMNVTYLDKFISLDNVYLSGIEIQDGVEETTYSLNLNEDEIFALGDNRKDSLDSLTKGPFKTSAILGKVINSFRSTRLITSS